MGAYKAILVEADSYLLELSRYIHLNPVTAMMCQYPIWSSYNSYIGLRKKEKWLHTDVIFSYLKSVEKYVEFVQEGVPDALSKVYGRSHLPSILGTKNFIENKLNQLTDDQLSASSHDIRRTQLSIAPLEVIDKVIFYFQKDLHSLINSTRGQFNIPKNICIC